MTTTIIIVAIVLFLSVWGTAVIHKREQRAKQIRQKVAQHKYRAGETQVLLEQLTPLGLPNFIRIPVLEYISHNYKSAMELLNEDRSIESNYNGTQLTLEELKQNPTGGGEKLRLPNKGQDLKIMISKLKRFRALYLKLKNEGFLGQEGFEERLKYLKKTQLQLEAEGFIKIGRRAMSQRQMGTAKQYLIYAQQRLTNCGIVDAYVQKQLERIQMLLDEIAPAKEEESSEAENKRNKSTDDLGDAGTIFGPKKKW